MSDRPMAGDESRGELERLGETLTDEQLALDVGGGWTVATVFAHLAFRDRLLEAHWRAALARGEALAADASLTSHLVNDALDELLAAVPPRVAVSAALEAAAAIDCLLTGLAPSVLAETASAGPAWLTDRSGHRREHLDQILAALR